MPGQSRNGKIRMLHVLGTFMHGGTEQLMLNLLSRLPNDVYEITVCCEANKYLPHVVQSFQAAGIRTVVFVESFRPTFVPTMARFIRQNRFAIVHTHHYYGNLYGRLAAILVGTPIIMTYQHNWPGEEKGRHRLAFRLLNSWTCRNITVSEVVRRYNIVDTGIAPWKVVTLHNGIDTSIFRPASVEQRIEAKQALGLPSTSEVVGMVGRLVDWKRFDLFIQAAAMVIEDHRDVHFLIVGDGEMRESLAQLVHHLSVGDHVHFLGWRTDMPAIYRAMDIFCLTSDSGGRSFSMDGGEGFGLVSIEAMASGLPVVAVDTEVNREVITAECGLFCKREPEDLATKISQLIGDPVLSEGLGRNGRRRAIEHFDTRQMANRLAAIYLEAVNSKKLQRQYGHKPVN